MAKRTDTHRYGALIPAHYVHVLFYSLPHTDMGEPCPSVGVDCTHERAQRDENGMYLAPGKHFREDGLCCWTALRESGVVFAQHGGLGQCTACGAQFLHGSVWKHENGEHIHMGHTCSDKACMLADRSEHELARMRSNMATKAATKSRLTRELNRERREQILAQYPDLVSALDTDHYIIRDIRARFQQTHALSDAQIALVFKIQKEEQEKAARPPEVHCDAPTGRITFTGTIVSVKDYEGDWGVQVKTTIKVTEADGRTWLAWGTLPRSCWRAKRGDQIRVKATLSAGREPHFALMKRPAGELLKTENEPEAEVA